MPTKTVAFVVALILSPTRLWSVQETAKPDGQAQAPNEAVVVTAPRLEIPLNEAPAATTVVSQEMLKATPRGIAAEEALRFVPGMKVDNQANGERAQTVLPDPDGNSYQPGPKEEIFITARLYLGQP